MRLTPKNELEYRYRKLQSEMAGAGIDAVIMVQNADLFYFTGTAQAGNLYVPASGRPIYLVRRDYLRARMESALAEVLPSSSLNDLPGLVSDHGHSAPKRLGLELDVLPVNLYLKYRALYPDAELVDASPLIRRVRMVKSHYEIHIMQDAGNQADKVYKKAAETIREGICEVELAAELERFSRLEGHQGHVRMRAFNGEVGGAQVLAGPDAAAPAAGNTALGGMGLTPAFGHGASYNRIRRGEPVVVDFASCFDGYLVDQTRVFAIGSVSDRMRRGYQDMLRIEELMMEMAEVGTSWGGIYHACLDLACEMGYADNFMGTPGSQVPFIGHGLGIEIDEYPFIARGFESETLQVGMAFAFEPKLVFPGEGAVGIENSFYLSEQGLKRLTFSRQELVLL
ncbi:prolidase family protein [Citrifermentans bemidjiense Bem]|uniref:Prolidase family protein n=1 Tax=Citrifermentans bemidjiense (strain ATCC BAA-1014 / DSM 16622 / JCM 12645 / Bem) TaxID=404380 RepID=B5E9C7_CITBB|nr:Xaa-Pro peptidase family protein [Citrifermentans bemidjiense]ACH38669.1 prolidase family protein [Citrifermentans bemidjiense Bem]